MTPFVNVLWPSAPTDITIESVTTTSHWHYDYSSHPVNLPADVQAGEVLWMVFRTGHNPTVHATPDGWTLADQGGSAGMISWFYRVADGSEGATVTIDVTSDGTTPRTSPADAIVYRLSGVATNEATWFAINHTGTTPNPAVSAPWGAMANLFITDFSSRYSDWTVTAHPANYVDRIFIPWGSTSANSSVIASVHRFLEAASDTVGDWTLDAPSGTIGERYAVAVFRPVGA